METASDPALERNLTMDVREMKNASRADLEAYVDELRNDLTEVPVDASDFHDRIESMSRAAEMVDTHLTLMDLEEHRARTSLAATRGGVRSSGGNEMDARSLGELIVSDDMVAWARRDHGGDFGLSLTGQGSLDDLFTRAISEWSSTGAAGGYDPSGAGNLLPVGQPIAPIPRQARLYLRDLIPTMTTTLAAIPYVQELNPTEYESASSVAEGALKPNATLSFQGAKADPTVIAATLVISKQLFEDAQAVVQYINTRLPYLVKFKEDNEILNGSGTWPDITGILNQAGVLTQAYNPYSASGNANAQTFGAAFAQVENHDGTPTAVVVNPTNAWSMFTARAAGGAGTFDAGTPFSALPLTVWGVPSYRTRAMPANAALVGDFQLGAMIADREEVNIQTYRERYAEMNQILMVCEERMGLMVFRPDLFVSLTSLV
jgi:HK97 family phage major capsid protein